MYIKMLQRLVNMWSGTQEPSAVAPLAEGLGFTIRLAYPDDESSLWRLAALDSQPLSPGPHLVAEVDGQLWAAVSIAGEPRPIADPFHHTAALVTLLRHQAAGLAGPRATRPIPQTASIVAYP